jgi:hypothetical protein
MNIKRLAVFLVGLMVALSPAAAATAGSHSSGRSSHSSGAHHPKQGGHYAGGKGPSHKGGHYKNPRTNDHYTKHK